MQNGKRQWNGLMAQETFQGKKHYVARFGGGSVVFQSYWMLGTFGIGADAIQACNQAGLAVTFNDWDNLVIDGPYRTRWSARRAARMPLSEGEDVPVIERTQIDFEPIEMPETDEAEEPEPELGERDRAEDGEVDDAPEADESENGPADEPEPELEPEERKGPENISETLVSRLMRKN